MSRKIMKKKASLPVSASKEGKRAHKGLARKGRQKKGGGNSFLKKG